MCYDLIQKRNINVDYYKIRTKNKDDKFKEYSDQYIFNDYDKLYHIISYVIRCAVYEKNTIDSKVEKILDLFWLKDKRSNNSNYVRCILKKFKNYKKRYKQIYENVLIKLKSKEELEFIKNIFEFDYLKDIENDYDEDEKYKTFSLEMFFYTCCKYNAVRTGNKIKKELENFKTDDIWKYIMGEDIEDVSNEIAFYNEHFKNDIVTFCVNNPTIDLCNKIYNVFNSFLCIGEVLKNGSIRFTISYEKFEYRKVHMCLLSLNDIICNIQPDEVSDVLRKRKFNKSQNILF